MCSKIYLLIISVIGLVLTQIQSLEQNYYYNWQQLQPTYSPGEQNIGSGYQNQVPWTNAVTFGGENTQILQPFQSQGREGEATSEMHGGDGGTKTEGHQGYGYGYGGYSGPQPHVSYGHEAATTEHPMMTEMKKLGPDAILKILLTILPVIICLIFVPSLMVTIGLLLIPVIQWDDY